MYWDNSGERLRVRLYPPCKKKRGDNLKDGQRVVHSEVTEPRIPHGQVEVKTKSIDRRRNHTNTKGLLRRI